MIYHLKTNGQNNVEQAVELANLEEICDEFKFDIRYARGDNFIGRAVYSEARAFLLKHVAEDLFGVHLSLRAHGYGLLIYDGYRPWSVTKLFWDESNDHDRQFLANPESGSSHNRGCAVDLSMYSLATGRPVTMPSDFDEMNEKAYTHYLGGTAQERAVRDLLQKTMLENGFTGIKNEWWHFNHISNTQWPVMDFTFEEILRAPKTQHPLLRR
jgi:D-alanyl-D-alanine dipeptidase